MSKPMPRRRALRMLGGALVTVALPGVLRPQSASGGGPKPAGSLGFCEKTCSNPTPVPCICKNDRDSGPYAGCFETCGPPGSFCCCLKGSDGFNSWSRRLSSGHPVRQARRGQLPVRERLRRKVLRSRRGLREPEGAALLQERGARLRPRLLQAERGVSPGASQQRERRGLRAALSAEAGLVRQGQVLPAEVALHQRAHGSLQAVPTERGGVREQVL